MAITNLIERIAEEGAIGCGEAARIFGSFRSGRPIHTTTVKRMCVKGIRLPNGRQLKLEHFKSTGKIVTSRAAIIRFLSAQQSAEDAEVSACPSPGERRRAAELAVRELIDSGA